VVGAALKYASEQNTPKKIVTFACDTGNKYLSKMYSDEWMSENGFMNKQKQHSIL
jgi:cystathionine beta-synthase